MGVVSIETVINTMRMDEFAQGYSVVGEEEEEGALRDSIREEKLPREREWENPVKHRITKAQGGLSN